VARNHGTHSKSHAAYAILLARELQRGRIMSISEGHGIRRRRRLGRYTIIRPLGPRGHVLVARLDGIGEFQRHVALKQIGAIDPRDPRFAQLALLGHRNIVRVHDVERAGGGFVVAMEYVHGEDLQAVIGTLARKRKQLPIGVVVAIIQAIAEGLEHAHQRGVIHGDPSPSNVLVGYDGAVKLVDFGMTREVDGNIGYMSPEQCRGVAIDRRSDVYTLGVVLYELATASRLFTAETDDQVVERIVHGRIPSPSTRRADLPEGLCEVIARALAPDPSRRFPTTRALHQALEPFADRLVSSGSLAQALTSLFGTRPEPWLEPPPPVETPVAALPPLPVLPVAPSRRIARVITPSLLGVAAIIAWQVMGSSPSSDAATPKPSAAAAHAPILPTLAPPPIELPELSRDVVNKIAAKHAKELAQCAGHAKRHGEVTILFTVDPQGAVDHAQADVVDEDPKVGTCLIRAVQRWKLSISTPSGARGTYAVVYQ